MKIKFKIEANTETNTLNTLEIDDKVFHMTDRDVTTLLKVIDFYRDDLVNSSINSILGLERTVQKLNSTIEDLNDEISNLQDEVDDLQYELDCAESED